MLKHRLTALSLLLVALSVEHCQRDAFGQARLLDTPEKLWRDFRADVPDLEAETVRSWSEDQIQFEAVRFTAERESEGRVRVFALRGAPSRGSQLPGILHIHGGGQTASLDWIRFWARRGYVCVSYDFTGPWSGRKEFTDWGPIKQANLAQSEGGLQLQPTPRASSWYHWAVAARRALTLLSYHPRVNRERLGIFGVSIGGTLCWLVAAMDDRVKTTVAIYGCGHTFDKRKTAWGFPENEPGLSLFNRVLAPEAYAREIHRSVLLLDATNDFHGWMDHAYEILADVDGPSRLAFTPRYNHHIDEAQGRDLPAWMDWQLRDGPSFPAAPKFTLGLNQQGDPLAEVRPADESQVSRVEVFYALGEKPPPNRFWRRATTFRSRQAWEAPLPVLNLHDPLRAFANVFYRSGVCLSTKLVRTIPARLGAARGSLTWSDSPAADPNEAGSPFVYALANTDPNVSPAYFVESRDADRPAAVCVNPAIFGPRINFAIVSHYIGEPGYKGRDGDFLCFEYQGNFVPDSESKRSGTINRGEPGFSVLMTAHDWTPRAKSYTARVASSSLAGWCEVKLPPASFVAADGQPLPSWSELDKIEIRGVASRENPPCFARFRWSRR